MCYVSTNRNIIFIKNEPQFISVVLAKCDEYQLNLIELVANALPLSSEYKETVMKLYKINTSTRLKYQKL